MAAVAVAAPGRDRSRWYEVVSDDESASDDEPQEESRLVHDHHTITVSVPHTSSTVYTPASASSSSSSTGPAPFATHSRSSSRSDLKSDVSGSSGSSGARSVKSSAASTCADVSSIAFTALFCAASALFAYCIFMARSLYISAAPSCSQPVDHFVIACMVQAAAFGGLLLLHLMAQLRSLCSHQPIAPFLENKGCLRALEALIVVAAVAQIGLGIWGELWLAPLGGLLRVIVPPVTCGGSLQAQALWSAVSFIAIVEEAAATFMIILIAVSSVTACCTRSRATATATATVATPSPAAAPRTPAGMHSEQLSRTRVAAVPTTTPSASPLAGSRAPSATSSNPASAFRGASYHVKPAATTGAGAALPPPRQSRKSRKTSSRSCS